jgi:hypothetical protein
MLKDGGFRQATNRTTSIFSEITQKSFDDMFGKNVSNALIDDFVASEMYNKLEPFSNYDTFDKWLLEYFHEDGTEKILQIIKQNIEGPFERQSGLSLREIIPKNQKQDVFDFIHNIGNKEHPLLLFYDVKIRDEIINEFFNPKFTYSTITGCFTHTPEKYHCDNTITYDEILVTDQLDINKIMNFFEQVYDNKPNTPPRFACEDTSWFAESGLFEEHQQIGNKMSSLVLNNSIIMCCYDLARINQKQLELVIQSRNYIILEDPFCAFVRGELM